LTTFVDDNRSHGLIGIKGLVVAVACDFDPILYYYHQYCVAAPGWFSIRFTIFNKTCSKFCFIVVCNFYLIDIIIFLINSSSSSSSSR
jgi:hypothetical protein